MPFEIHYKSQNPAQPWDVYLGNKKVKGASFSSQKSAEEWIHQYRNYQFLD